jgi:tRNA(Ile)-lysidine synthase
MIVEQKAMAMIQRHGLLSHDERVLVAVSGGPDSVALVHVLHQFRHELRLELEVAHLQHGIRGQDATEDARFVAELAEKLELPVHLKEINLPKMKLDAGKGNLEALARAERYRFFADVAHERHIRKVATAHTQDDQAETVLMWFLRGTGLKGVGGMAPLHRLEIDAGNSSESLTVIRPLLEVSKAEILRYLEDRRLGYRIDRSNQDSRLLRNWLRLDLLPIIKRRFDERVPARLGRQAEIFRDEDALLSGLARKGLAECRDAGGLSREKFVNQPKALQRRILRLWIEQARGHLRGLEFVHIDDILRLIEGGPPQGRLSIPGGWELVREYESLKFEKRVRSRRGVCYDYRLEAGVILRIPEANLEVRGERISAPPEALPNDLMEAVFDLALLPGALSVRNFRRGDRFAPLGMTGHKKIKDLFIEKRVPLSIRSRWPLLAAGKEILWIPGYGRSAAGAVSTQTTAVLHLKVRPI